MDPPPSGDLAADAERGLDRAALAHWREAADAYRRQLDELRRRPVLRAAMRVDRSLAPLRARTARVLPTMTSAAARAALAADAIRGWRSRTDRAARLEATVGGLPTVERGGDVTMVIVDDAGSASGSGGVGDLGRRVAAATTEFVCLCRSTVEPLDGSWVDRLTAAMADGVGAATAHVVHPARPLLTSTAHDLLTRERGIDIQIADGVPAAVAIGAGEAVRSGGSDDVAASSASAVLLRADAVRAVGGMAAAILEPDAAVVDLCVRMAAAGQRTVAVADALVIDHRPVGAREDLRAPIRSASRSWRGVVESRGPSLVAAAGRRGEGLRLAVTTAVPNRKLVDRWGDWHLAGGLARSLESLGHDVLLQRADQADDLAGRACDVHVVVRGLHPVRRTSGQVHVLWVVSHPESLSIDECDEADLVCVASARHAAWLRVRTTTPVVVLLQATDHRLFRPVAPDPAHRHPITVVAKSRERLRDAVDTALASGLRPAIYGSGWEGLVDPELIVSEYVPNDVLPTVYCSADVVLNDHWATMRASGFVSNRLFDVLACGVPVVSDQLPEIDELFGETVPTYEDAASLRRIVEEQLDDREGSRQRAARGRSIVLSSHTFDHRAGELVGHLHDVGVVEPGRVR